MTDNVPLLRMCQLKLQNNTGYRSVKYVNSCLSCWTSSAKCCRLLYSSKLLYTCPLYVSEHESSRSYLNLQLIIDHYILNVRIINKITHQNSNEALSVCFYWTYRFIKLFVSCAKTNLTSISCLAFRLSSSGIMKIYNEPSLSLTYQIICAVLVQKGGFHSANKLWDRVSLGRII